MGAGTAQCAYSGMIIRRVLQLVVRVLSSEPLLAVPFMKHKKQDNTPRLWNAKTILKLFKYIFFLTVSNFIGIQKEKQHFADYNP